MDVIFFMSIHQKVRPMINIKTVKELMKKYDMSLGSANAMVRAHIDVHSSMDDIGVVLEQYQEELWSVERQLIEAHKDLRRAEESMF